MTPLKSNEHVCFLAAMHDPYMSMKQFKCGELEKQANFGPFTDSVIALDRQNPQGKPHRAHCRCHSQTMSTAYLKTAQG